MKRPLPKDALPLAEIEATDALAIALVPYLKPGTAFCLRGPLGSGKTTFARSLLRSLGITGDIPSPTFTLMQTYETAALVIHHFDLYRLKTEDELDELGWEEALADAAALIEWPERAGSRQPTDRLDIEFKLDGNERSCSVTPHGRLKSEAL